MHHPIAIADNLVGSFACLQLLLQQGNVRSIIIFHARVQQHLGCDDGRCRLCANNYAAFRDARVVANHAEDVRAKDRHVHNPRSPKAVADRGHFGRINIVVALDQIEGSVNFAHVERGVPTMFA